MREYSDRTSFLQSELKSHGGHIQYETHLTIVGTFSTNKIRLAYSMQTDAVILLISCCLLSSVPPFSRTIGSKLQIRHSLDIGILWLLLYTAANSRGSTMSDTTSSVKRC